VKIAQVFNNCSQKVPHMTFVNNATATEIVRAIDDYAARELPPLSFSATDNAWQNLLKVLESSCCAENFFENISSARESKD
jgi:hypothetical protein